MTLTAIAHGNYKPSQSLCVCGVVWKTSEHRTRMADDRRFERSREDEYGCADACVNLVRT